MSRGINKVILVGHVGFDPILKQMPNGYGVVNLVIATNIDHKNKTTGQKVTHTEWHKLVFFSTLAEIVNKIVKKGNKIYVEGSLRTKKWKNADNMDIYSTEIICHEIQLLDSRKGEDGKNEEDNIGNYFPPDSKEDFEFEEIFSA
jgi:single-strand DNA-binding protein